MRWIVKLIFNAIAVVIAAEVLDSIQVSGMGAALTAGLILSIVNTFFRPVLVFLTFPLTIVTLGLFLLIINALMLMLTSALVPGFTVVGFGGAFWGAVIVSFVSWLLNGLFRK